MNRTIKKERLCPQDYTSPRVEVFEINVESGFAASMGNNSTEDFGTGSSYDW